MKRLTNLTSLNLYSCEMIGNDCIQCLTKLSELCIASSQKISDEGIKNLSLLTYLDANIRITDEGIKNLTNLTHLDFNYNGNISASAIKKLPNLKSVLKKL